MGHIRAKSCYYNENQNLNMELLMINGQYEYGNAHGNLARYVIAAYRIQKALF